MKTICIYHRIDLDGWMSAAIVKHWFNQQEVPNKEGEDCNTLDFLGWNYGDEIPNLSGYDKVIMCDVSFPPDEMFRLFYYLDDDNFIWIDHHISAINNSEGRDYESTTGIRDVGFAACELTWMYLMQDITEISDNMDAINEPMPEIVRLLGMYDSFRHKGTDEEQKVLEFQYGARSLINNYDMSYYYLDRDINSEKYYGDKLLVNKHILEKGQAIYEYLCTEAKQTYKNGFEIVLNEEDVMISNLGTVVAPRKFVCINRERFNPINFGIDYHSNGYDGAACFHYDGDMWNFSLYNDNGEVDCSRIAKMYGGGGHKGAAGFKIKELKRIIN